MRTTTVGRQVPTAMRTKSLNFVQPILLRTNKCQNVRTKDPKSPFRIEASGPNHGAPP